MHALRPLFSALVSGWILAACSTVHMPSFMDSVQWQQHLSTASLPAILLLGEQHDAPEHQQWQLATIQGLIKRQQLGAVVLEMADHGYDTQGLAATATESEVQQTLKWNDEGWPWKAYGPSVMAAVRAGVPIFGGNLPRMHMKEVMQQTLWDSHLPATAWDRQRDAIRSGHCDLLPEHQIAPMARIQLAKDARMAQTATSLLQPAKTVVLIAGRGHVLRSIGIPTWLPAHVHATVAIGQAGDKPQSVPQDSDFIVRTPAVPEKDHCTALKAQWHQLKK